MSKSKSMKNLLKTLISRITNLFRLARPTRLKIRLIVAVVIVLIVFIMCTITYYQYAERKYSEIAGVLEQISDSNKSVLHNTSTVVAEPPVEFACQEAATTPSTHVLLMVISSPENHGRRDVIRSTIAEKNTKWERYFLRRLPKHGRPTRTLRTLFFMGLSNGSLSDEVLQEGSLHKDIIVDAFVEHYFNLTLKTLRMMKWVHRRCSTDVNYLVKMDDDVYLNVPQLFDLLLTQGHPTLVAGHLYKNVGVIRDITSKWLTPPAVYPSDTFPTFASGTCYILGIEAVSLLLEESKYAPLLHLEDVYVTGILANERLHLNLTQFGSYNLELVWYQSTYPLKWLQTFTAVHPVTSAQFACWIKNSFPRTRSSWPIYFIC